MVILCSDLTSSPSALACISFPTPCLFLSSPVQSSCFLLFHYVVCILLFSSSPTHFQCVLQQLDIGYPISVRNRQIHYLLEGNIQISKYGFLPFTLPQIILSVVIPNKITSSFLVIFCIKTFIVKDPKAQSVEQGYNVSESFSN